MSFTLTPETTGTHTFGITSNGLTRLFVNNVEIVSHPGYTDTKVEYIMEPGHFEKRGNVAMEAGKEYQIRIDALSTTAPAFPPPAFHIPPQATQVGFFENMPSLTIASCEELARESDVSIVFTGDNFEFESESFDRKSFNLPLGQDELISRVAAASKKTVVVNQTGSAIAMPWLGDVDALLQNWFAGMQVGNAVAGLISGTVNPSGRLPNTWPKKVEDVLSNVNFPRVGKGEEKIVRYEEGLQVGYRALMRRDIPEPKFVFGYGLSYAKFEYGGLQIEDLEGPEIGIKVSVSVKNISSRAGKEVVQVYVNGVLKGFAKVEVQPASTEQVSVMLDRMAFSKWLSGGRSKMGANGEWKVAAGMYRIDVRKDAPTVLEGGTYKIQESQACEWEGL